MAINPPKQIYPPVPAAQSTYATSGYVSTGLETYSPNTQVTSTNSVSGSRSFPDSLSLGRNESSNAPPRNAPGSPAAGAAAAVGTLNSLKEWTTNTYKYAKQVLAERLGSATRTCDPALDDRIASLQELHRRYQRLVTVLKAYATHLSYTRQTQAALGDVLREIGSRTPSLAEQFQCNAEIQRIVSKNSESLVTVLDQVSNALAQLCSTTIADTFETIRLYQQARVEYDAQRNETEALRGWSGDATKLARLDEAQSRLDTRRSRFERLRNDVSVKLELLDENRLRVVAKQLADLDVAFDAFFANNARDFEALRRAHPVAFRQLALTPDTNAPSHPSAAEVGQALGVNTSASSTTGRNALLTSFDQIGSSSNGDRIPYSLGGLQLAEVDAEEDFAK